MSKKICGIQMIAAGIILTSVLAFGGDVHAAQNPATEAVVTEATTQEVSTEITTEAKTYTKPGTTKVTGKFSKGKIVLSWNKVKKADTYYIYRKNAKGKYVKIAQTGKLKYTDKSVKKGEYYNYKVTATYQADDKVIAGKKSKACKVLADTIDPNKKMVALTFDDGPGRYTKTIVNCLKKNDAHATFFVVGSSVDSYRDSVKYAYKAGCEIGSHSYNHSDLAKLSAKDVKAQMSDTDKKIKKATGKKATLMRPPYGSVGKTVSANVGKPMILWSIDTLDWKTRNTQKTVDAVMKNVKDGDIVLMHDIHEPTKDAALKIIPKLKAQGYQLVTVSELAKYRGYSLQKGQKYFSLRKKTKK